ncbi:hypothetical protein RhiirA5_377173 [Rhizophagus irregularis]|uniref:Uncharacterized protein n=3 Tax=Rhizophagus irregularis TaxID=588596 RepID=U9TWN3_RHIID|nr:hypothetical protein GLOIN_2v1474674 [Rhizophagus irregularis DAOM 181602=DAOM 197198]EXX54989.1 hypothetical protein RirG_229440 [Rhizophagus irregularis DAOM 197198w]PKC07286.1 hypothetical protein RhiirA5_377173 [Rhizophagus irregularis]PKC60308.1 hypothetical protein RhiirA1_399271 [Rhizophagus irregularis]PKY43074.1 hypothetical protein RhiirA4_457002 [Rhizophagus irregularis]POG76296.1 hypothetical protein GLOIN_2v1474674 [Rhizophagus irregularis DAOM 181602=DAOM 197198]|eukprot:XP_025183162.1 hypothetical protein GLOIN_2v1474674 [Rhizophagus irregularis DAOM 181602=DAOM 197198]
MSQQSQKYIFIDTIQDPESLIQEIKELASKLKYSFALPIEELMIPNSSTPQNSFFMFKRDQMARLAGTENLKTNYYEYKQLFELLYKLQVMYRDNTPSTSINSPTTNDLSNEFERTIDNFIQNDPEINSIL